MEALNLFTDQPPQPRPTRDQEQARKRKRGVATVIYELMTRARRTDDGWWTLPELERALASRGHRVLMTSISARLRDLRRAPFNASVQSRTRAGSTHLVEYHVGAA